MSANKNTRYELFSQGIFIDPMVNPDALQSLTRLIRPKQYLGELIRIGANSDGGYLIPDDLSGIKSCFSPGVDDIASFEQDLYVRGIGSHLADYSVEEVPPGTKSLSFIKKFLGANSYDHFISLDDWVNLLEPDAPEDSLLLQMDIEGSEYETLLACSTKTLSKFGIMVIEFHQIESWSQPDFFKIVESTFRKITQTHHVVHNHPNNAMGIVNMNGFLAPRVFELTLIKKTKGEIKGFSKLPHPLDYPNVDYLPDINLPSSWFD